MYSNPQSLGNIYKMSRNKDKYENSNPRRQQTFMSQEDVAAGRKSNWHGVEITGNSSLAFQLIKLNSNVQLNFSGNVRNVSASLWHFEHLTALYLNDNNLLRLPNDIGLLVNLRTLDISSNKLRSLPAELGELIHLR